MDEERKDAGGQAPEAGALRPPLLATLTRVTRLGVAIPVLLLCAGALVAFLYDVYLLVHLVVGAVQAPTHSGEVIVGLVRLVDVALIGVVLFIVAVGLEELFLAGLPGRRRSWLPPWLAVHDLQDLKEPLLASLVLVAVVAFVDEAVSSGPNLETLELGAGVAAVVVAVGAYLRLAGRGGPGGDRR